MSDNIVGLRGRPQITEDGAEASVIAELELLTEAAKRGEIVAFAIVTVRPSQDIGTMIRNPSGSRHLLAAGATYLTHDLSFEKGDRRVGSTLVPPDGGKA